MRQATGRGALAAVCVLALTAFAGIGAPAALGAAPSVSVEAAEVGFTSAEAKGSIDPGGNETSYHFEYITDAKYAENEANGHPGFYEGAEFAGFSSTSSAGAVEPVQLGVLTPALAAGTTYRLRLIAENGEGSTVSATVFTTQAATPPAVTIEPVGTPGYTSVHVAGEIDPEGGNLNPIGPTPVPIAWEFQVNREGAGWEFASGTVPGGSQVLEGSQAESKTTVEEQIEGLAPAAEYEVRLHAVRAGAEALSAEPFESFTTLDVSPSTVSIDPASSITASSAHFSGQVNAGNADPAFNSPCAFEYIAEAAFQKNISASKPGFEGASQVGCNVEPSGAGSTVVEADASGLAPHTTYHLRLVAKNLGGEEIANAANFTTEALAPLVKTIFAGELTSSEATLHGQVNPQSSQSAFWFEWGAQDCSANPCQSVPLSQDGDAGSANVYGPVKETLAGLLPETTYHFRLLAENSAGLSEGIDRTFTTQAPEEEGCPNEVRRSEEGADRVLPDCRAWEMVSPPEKAGNDVIGDTSRIQLAQPESEALPAAATFASFGAFAGARGTGIATEYLSQRGGKPGTRGWATHAITPAGEPLSFLAGSQGYEPAFIGEMSSDLTEGLFRAWMPLTNAPNVKEVPNLYLRDDLRASGNGNYELLTDAVTALPPNTPGAQTPRPWMAGSSADLHHVLYENRLNLTADASGQNVKLYKSDDGVPRLVSDGTGVCPGGKTIFAPCSTAGLGATVQFQTPRVISTDGSRINFTAPVMSQGSVGSQSKLYQLDDQDTPTAADDTTIQLNASEKSVPNSPSSARYQTASTDGSRVFFTSTEQLTETPGSGLYMWERQPSDETQSLTVDATGGSFTLTARLGALEATTAPLAFNASAAEVQSALEALKGPAPSEQRILGEGNVAVSGGPGASAPFELTFVGALGGVNVPQLSADASGLSGGASTATVFTTDPVQNLVLIGPGGTGTLGASEDGHRVYFGIGVSTGQLIPGGPPLEQAGLYLWQDARGTPSLSFVGGVTADDLNAGLANQVYAFYYPFARVTPDGRHLAFTVINGSELAPAYPHGRCSGQAQCTMELYVYSADSSTPLDPDLVCASCDFSTPEAPFPTLLDVREGGGATQRTAHMPRNITDDGRRVFFSTAEPLVSEDTNSSIDAYSYDVPSGTVHLISSGTDPFNSYLMDVTPDGHDAYFVTREKLLGWDKDAAYDLYDARIGGGFPEPPNGTAPCNGDSCLGPVPPAPPVAPVSSSAVSGAGNPKVRHQRKKRHRKARHHKSKKRAEAARNANHNRRAGR